MNKKKSLVIAIYSHTEYYPPTLNAIDILAKEFYALYIIESNVLDSNWIYPSNSQRHAVGRKITIRDFEKSSVIYKILHFCKFTYKLFSQSRKADTIMLYDGIPLLAYRICRFFGRRNKLIWYHNHDVYQPDLLRSLSITWFAYKNEKTAFKWIDIFSLPSNGRKQYFDLKYFGGQYFYIPNFPSKKFYSQFSNNHNLTDPLRVLYQGSIGEGHGIEEIIKNWTSIESGIGKKMRIVLKGFISEDFKALLLQQASNSDNASNLEFYSATAYGEVPLITQTCHIGIAIHTGLDRMNNTLGTASNKIYEYAACGLPVLYFNSEQFIQHLENFEWAIATDINLNSLVNSISTILHNYYDFSVKAQLDFNEELNYEIAFIDVLKYLKKHFE